MKTPGSNSAIDKRIESCRCWANRNKAIASKQQRKLSIDYCTHGWWWWFIGFRVLADGETAPVSLARPREIRDS
jgi:hypothetical protein